MTEAQFQALVRFVEKKVGKIDPVDSSEGEPWHVALKTLTGEYSDITRDELVLSVQGLFTQCARAFSAEYMTTGSADSLSDLINSTVITILLEGVRAIVAVNKFSGEEAA